MLETIACYAVETAIRFAAVQLANSGFDVLSSDVLFMRLAKLLLKRRIGCHTTWLRVVERLVPRFKKVRYLLGIGKIVNMRWRLIYGTIEALYKRPKARAALYSKPHRDTFPSQPVSLRFERRDCTVVASPSLSAYVGQNPI